ncbi:MAG: hypothetical protein MI863_02175 [Desulfobacterales bacterium]|nr:hypothetical protein [Desulfobacterales bacterium]
MAETKEETVLNFLNSAYDGYEIDPRENAITVSYDFIFDTGTAKIIMKLGRKRWDDSDGTAIVDYLKSKEQQINSALLTNEDAILSMK